jgi:putative MATE family efflux protein
LIDLAENYQGTFRPMLRLAVPVLAEETLNLFVAYTDWWLVGHYLQGSAYKAAMGLMSYMMWLVPSMFAAAAIGATALVARYIGAGDRRKASHVANQALLIGVFFAILAIAVTEILGQPFISLMQLEGDAAGHAWIYLSVLIPVIPMIMFERVGIACLHGAGDTVTGLVIKIIVNIVNVVISASLVTGWGPFPNLGWMGIAVGTAAAHLTGGLLLLAVFARGRAGLRLRRKSLRPDFPTIRRLLRIGLPGGVDIAAIIGCHLVYVAIINRLGTEAAAAHGLGVQIEAMAYLPGTAFMVAASTMAGQYLGAGDPSRAVRGVLNALAGAVSVLTLAALVFYFGGGALTTFFTGDPNDATGQETASLLKIVAFATPFLAVIQVISGASRGAGDTRWPLAINLAGFVLIRLPGACILAWPEIPVPFIGITIPGFGLGVAGAWYAMAADVIVRGLLFAGHFLRGSWKRTEV